jgi:hypothetical protein
VTPRRKAVVAISVSLVVLLLLVGGAGYTAWSEHLRMRPRFLQVSKQGIGSIYVNERGDLAAVVAGDKLFMDPLGPVRSVRLDTGVEIGELEDSVDKITGGLAVSDDGELVAVGISSRARRGKTSPVDRVETWSLRQAKRVAGFPVDGLSGIAFTPDGEQLVEGRAPSLINLSDPIPAGRIEYRDLGTGEITRSLPVSKNFRWIERAGQNLLLEICATDQNKIDLRGALKVRILATGELIEPSLDLADLSVATAARAAVFATFDEKWTKVVVRSLPSGRTLRAIGLGYELGSDIALSPDGEHLATICYDAPRNTFVDLFRVSTGERLRTWSFGRHEVTAVTFMPHTDTLAIGTTTGRLELHPFRR